MAFALLATFRLTSQAERDNGGELIMIPKTVYEMLPYVYIAVGIAAALLIYNSYAIVAGILLLTVSFVILHMRLKNRTDKMERFERLYMREKKKNE